jgi:hypothetical protein
VVLFTGAATRTETPPLRACRSPVGQRAEVPVPGDRGERVVFGALDPATGAGWPGEAPRWNQHTFQDHLRNIRAVSRGWNVVLFLDRGGPRTARAGRTPAAEPGVELRFRPTACPERTPAEGLRRHPGGGGRRTSRPPDPDDGLGRMCDERFEMSGTERRRPAGVLSGDFWLPT